MTAKPPYEVQKNLQAPLYMANDLQILEHYYSLDQSGKGSSVPILDFFARQPNVYLYALDLMFYSRDFFKGRLNSFPQFVLEALREWTASNRDHILTLDVKCLAVNRILMQSSGFLVQMVCETFRIKENYDYFRGEIRNILRENKFKEAYYLITSLNAERDFTLQEFVFPVFFLDKEPWVKHFLSKDRQSQIVFLTTLDSVCQHNKDIENFVRSLPYIGLPIRKHAYDPSRLQKLLANYLEHFDIDIKTCQNLYQVRCRNAMNYLIRKRYKEDSIGKEAFLETTEAVLADNPFLQKELMMKLVCSGDTDTALKFAKIFRLDKNEWPDILRTLPVGNVSSETVDAPSYYNGNYLNLRLDASDVHMVDTPEELIDVVNDIAENYDVVGMDAEWRPNLGITKENLSIFQIAVWDAVYLLDVLSLKRYPDQGFWRCVIDKILNNKNILKLGYGCRVDLQQLISLYPGAKLEQSKLPHVLDFCEFFKKLEACYPSLMSRIRVETDCASSGKGLSQLCTDLLGKPLNKDEQFSDWERRPLRKGQTLYAALDAFCLLLMYEKLFHVVQDSKLNFEDVIRKTFSSSLKVENVKKNNKKQVKKKVPNHKARPVAEFKVVVDNMIHGLGKYLRLCGADVAFLDNDDDHMKAVEICNAENRIILTAGAPYQKISGYVPENMCYCVPVDVNAKAQALHVLEYFNVQCRTSDIFSRCSICSGNNFQKVPKEELYPLWLSKAGSVEAIGSRRSHEDRILESGVPVQVSTLTPRVFETVSLFFICVQCGKVYWEGSHYSRMKKAFSQLIEEGEGSGKNIYHQAAEESEVQKSGKEAEAISKEDAGLSSNPVAVTRPRNYMSFDVDDGNSSDDELDDIVY